MSGWEMLAVAAAGFAAGGINAVVGSSTLVTVPALLAVGLPPVTASISNSIGLVPGNLTGAVGYRRELAGQRGLVLRLLPASVLGAMTGAFLLLHLPAESFERIVPALIGVAVVLVVTQPALQRYLARRRADAGVETPMSIGPGRMTALFAGAYATGSYGGYFAASQGVLQIGIFGMLIPESLQRLNALKNVLTTGVNGVAALAYILVASDRIDWQAVALVAGGSIAGGYLGASLGRRIPAPVLRAAIAVLGVVAIVGLTQR